MRYLCGDVSVKFSRLREGGLEDIPLRHAPRRITIQQAYMTGWIQRDVSMH